MASFIEIIYIDSDDDARQTGLRCAGSTNAETWHDFNNLRRHAVDIKDASFLVDYHNRKGDLADTIPIDGEGFRAITGRDRRSDAEYRQIDEDFWESVRSPAPAAHVEARS